VKNSDEQREKVAMNDKKK